MTKPTTTTNPSDTIAQVLALQSRRIATMEATLRRIEAMIDRNEATLRDLGPHEAQEGGVTP